MSRPKLTFANVIAMIALFVSLGGTVYAAAKIDGKTIRKGSIPANRLKPDSLSGAQVNEAALGTVPRAQRAQEAARVTLADRTASVPRADAVASAESATEATTADLAKEAAHARSADEALAANDARHLLGLPPSDYFAVGCAEQTIKAAAHITVANGRATVGRNFNCSVQAPPGVEITGTGEFRVTFPGLPGGAGFPVVSAMERGLDASARALGNNTFLVHLYGVAIERGFPGQFTLAIL